MTNNDDQSLIDPTKIQTSQSVSYVQVENPGVNITQIAFNGKNYDEWSRAFHLALFAKGKLGYIDGTIPKPSTGAHLESWKSTNALVTSWIFNSIEFGLRKMISYRPEAKQVWLDIKKRFCQRNDTRLFQLQVDLVACRQGPTESLLDYYGRISKLWDDILELDALPSCSCNPCRCDWVTLMDAHRDIKRVRDFLIGLDDRFDGARTQILEMNPLPNLDLAFNILLQVEGVHSFAPVKTETRHETMAFASKVQQPSRSGGGGHEPRTDRSMKESNPKFCIVCERNGHLYKTCFRVTEKFPDWWGDRPRDRIYINETDMSRTVVSDVQGRAKYDRNKTATETNLRANMVSGQTIFTSVQGGDGGSCSQSLTSLDKVDFNNLSTTELDELTQLWQARKSQASKDHLNGPFLKDGDWCG